MIIRKDIPRHPRGSGAKHCLPDSSLDHDMDTNNNNSTNSIASDFANLNLGVYEAPADLLRSIGWPIEQFTLIPASKKAQLGLISKGNHKHAIFVQIVLTENFNENVVKSAISQIPFLVSKISATDNHTSRTFAEVGIQPSLWKRWDPKPPSELKDFSTIFDKSKTNPVFPQAQPAPHIFLYIKSERADFCYEGASQFVRSLGDNVKSSSTVQGFKYMDGKDLTGFIDGTRQPDFGLRAVVDVAVINEESDEDQTHIGGTYLYTGRWIHDLKKFFSLDDTQKSSLVGRDYTKVVSHGGFDPRAENPEIKYPPSKDGNVIAHIHRGYGAMFRQAFPFQTTTEQGLFFTAASRSLTELEDALKRMSGHSAENGSLDGLFTFSHPVENMYWYIPSLVELNNLVKSTQGSSSS